MLLVGHVIVTSLVERRGGRIVSRTMDRQASASAAALPNATRVNSLRDLFTNVAPASTVPFVGMALVLVPVLAAALCCRASAVRHRQQACWPSFRCHQARARLLIASLVLGLAAVSVNVSMARQQVERESSLPASATTPASSSRPLWAPPALTAAPTANASGSKASEPRLARRAFEPLPLGAVTPRGWLATQLLLQAEGLSGHLALKWEKLLDSVWAGGTRGDRGGLNENTPYWLNGMVPLKMAS